MFGWIDHRRRGAHRKPSPTLYFHLVVNGRSFCGRPPADRLIFGTASPAGLQLCHKCARYRS